MKTAPSNLCFIDSETRRVPEATIEDVTRVGAYRYAEQAYAVMWTWCIGDEPPGVVALDDGFDRRLRWGDMPEEIRRFHERAERGEAWYVAWNAAFDRLIWNGPESDFPPLRPDMTLDAMSQAAAAGLPTRLMHAAKWVDGIKKLEQGAHLIKLFEPPNGATPQSRPDDWAAYKDYGLTDTDAMRDVWKATRPLELDEWQDYWVGEAINDRGFGLDVQLCAAASVLVDDSSLSMNKRINHLTDGAVTAVTQARRVLDWVIEKSTDPEAIAPLIEKRELLHDDGSVKREVKYSIARERIEKVLTYYASFDDLSEQERKIVEVLELRQYGGSTTPQKFSSALRVSHDRSLKGQYVFNGAAQTGRYSSRGVQVHNLTRAHLGEAEEEAIETIADIKDRRVDERLAAAGVAGHGWPQNQTRERQGPVHVARHTGPGNRRL